MTQEPPSFLLPHQLIELELAKQVHTHQPQQEEESLIQTAIVPAPEDSLFDSQFGGFSEGFDFQPSQQAPPQKDERFVMCVCVMHVCLPLGTHCDVCVVCVCVCVCVCDVCLPLGTRCDV